MKLRLFATAGSLAFIATVSSAETIRIAGNKSGKMALGDGYSMFGGPMMLVLWGLVAALVVMVVRLIKARLESERKALDPLDVLKTRFAKGELSQEEYLHQKNILEN